MELSDATEKSPVTPPVIDFGTFRLAAQCLNHYATTGVGGVVVKAGKGRWEGYYVINHGVTMLN
jgi:uncharacterized membrane protein